jgi:hypothetical protein
MSTSFILRLIFVISIGVALSGAVQAQDITPPSGQKSLAATMGVYAFPTVGQTPEQQSKDESDCYNWAVQNSGADPFQLNKQAEQQRQAADKSVQAAQESTEGTSGKAALGGAAAGALIGSFGGNAGKGALIGAGLGFLGGLMHENRAESQARAQAQQQTQNMQQYTQAQMDDFKKAFSVCLDAKKYMVKY